MHNFTVSPEKQEYDVFVLESMPVSSSVIMLNLASLPCFFLHLCGSSHWAVVPPKDKQSQEAVIDPV